MEFGVFFPKRTELFPLKDYKGHLVKKSSFKGLFEIKDSRTYTASGDRGCPVGWLVNLTCMAATDRGECPILLCLSEGILLIRVLTSFKRVSITFSQVAVVFITDAFTRPHS